LDVRYTLTISGDRLFARLGAQTIKDARPRARRPGGVGGAVDENSESILVCLDASAGKDSNRKRWMVRAAEPGRPAIFEGSPLASDGRVYIAATRFEGDRVSTAIHCYPAEPEDTTPLPLWRTEICETRELLPAGTAARVGLRERNRHHLLTAAGSRVVYCSHSGAIVALHGRTGSRAWAVRYPRRDLRDPEDDPGLRDLAPCLYANGLLYVAPTDSESVFCLDPATGATVWQRNGLDVVHLLGVGQGKLIFTTWHNPREGKLYTGGLRAVGALDGSDRTGWSLPDDGGGLAPFGRGLLLGDLVLWPTVRKPYGVFAVRQSDGMQPDNPSLLHRLPSGNLVYANGCMLVTDQQTMYAFVPPEMLADDARTDLSGPAAVHRARAAVARGQVEEALKQYEIVEAGLEARTARQKDRKQHVDDVRRERQDVYLAAAEKAIGQKDVKQGEEWLKKAKEGQPPRYRLAALLREIHLWQGVGDKERMRKACNALLDDSDLRFLTVDDENGLPQRPLIVARAPIMMKLERADHALPLRSLAQFWEKDGARRGARWAWRELQTKYGDMVDPRSEPKRTLGELAAEGLRRLANERETGPSGTLRISVEEQLAAGERFVTPRFMEGEVATRMWFAKGQVLICRNRETGGVEWNRTLPFIPEWLHCFGQDVVVGGTGGIWASSFHRGWRGRIFLAPPQRRYPGNIVGPGRVIREPPPPDPLHDFHLAGGRLFVLQGGRRLLALDVFSLEVLWQRWAPGAAFDMPAPRGRFGVIVPVGDDNLLVQASGRLLLLDAATGKVRREAPAPLERMPRVPLMLDGDRVCIVNPTSVEMLDAASAKALWTWPLPGKFTRSGQPPLVVAAGDDLYVVIPENIGYRLNRLDARTGKPAWAQAPLIPVESLDPDAWCAGPSALYCADGGYITARSRADGSVLWQRPLSAPGAWKLALAGDTLVLHSKSTDGLRFRFRWLAASVQWHLSPLSVETTPAVELLDAQRGTLFQRINLEDVSPRLQSRLEFGRSSVWPSVRFGREPVSDAGVAVWWDDKGLLVGLGNRVKSLSTRTTPEK
jgi:outer membrane protein assembly factor BamB